MTGRTATTATLLPDGFGSRAVGGKGAYSPVRGVVGPPPFPLRARVLPCTATATTEKWQYVRRPFLPSRPMKNRKTPKGRRAEQPSPRQRGTNPRAPARAGRFTREAKPRRLAARAPRHRRSLCVLRDARSARRGPLRSHRRWRPDDSRQPASRVWSLQQPEGGS